MKLAAYLRVSTADQVQGFGLDVQRDAIEKFAKVNKHEIVAWFVDAGVSGSNGVETREALPDALNAIAAGDAEGLVIYSLDRLARKLEHQEGILGRVWQAGGRVFSLGDGGEVLEDDPEDPVRTAMRQMRGVFSQLERAMIAKRMREGRRAKASQGGYAYGAPPYGHKSVGGVLVALSVDSERAEERCEAQTFQRIKQLHAKGLSLSAIAATLNAEGRRPKRGVAWYPSNVGKVVRRLPAKRQRATASRRPRIAGSTPRR